MKSFFRLCALVLLVILPTQAAAFSIIRDAEIEGVLRNAADPVYQAAGLDPAQVNMYIVNDRSINAFVSGGMNIFVHTGLMTQSPEPDMLIGVLAHEAGHIVGGHLTKNRGAYRDATIKTALGYGLGLIAAIAGSPEAGQAISLGASHVAQRQLLKYSRGHEEAADQAGLNYLDSLGYSADGLLELLQKLNQLESSRYGSLNPYTLTHPLSKERIAHVRNHIANSPFKTTSLPKGFRERYQRAITKLKAFLEPSEWTLNAYPESDTSDIARYARAVAYYKIPELEKSLSEIDFLIKRHPENPFYYEMKAQILFENGRIKPAIGSYKKASELFASNALLKIQLATAYIASENDNLLEPAIIALKQGLVGHERYNAFGWHQLGIAYGRKNDLGMSYLALTQEAAITNNTKDVELFSQLAKNHLKTGSPAYMRLQDILDTVDDKE